MLRWNNKTGETFIKLIDNPTHISFPAPLSSQRRWTTSFIHWPPVYLLRTPAVAEESLSEFGQLRNAVGNKFNRRSKLLLFSSTNIKQAINFIRHRPSISFQWSLSLAVRLDYPMLRTGTGVTLSRPLLFSVVDPINLKAFTRKGATTMRFNDQSLRQSSSPLVIAFPCATSWLTDLILSSIYWTRVSLFPILPIDIVVYSGKSRIIRNANTPERGGRVCSIMIDNGTIASRFRICGWTVSIGNTLFLHSDVLNW